MVKLLVFALFLVFVMSIAVPVHAAWWDSSYLYRMQINISNYHANDSNVPINISFTSSQINYSRFNLTGNDIRFVNGTNGIELSYWVEKWNTSGTSNVWVKLPYLANNTNATIYMYYGNSSVQTSGSPKYVFLAYDDFSDSSVNTTMWNVTAQTSVNTSTQNGNILKFVTGQTHNWGNNRAGLVNSLNMTRVDWLTFYYKFYANSTGDISHQVACWFSSTNGTWSPNNPACIAGFYFPQGNGVQAFQDGWNMEGATASNWNRDTWYEARIVLRSSGSQWYWKALSSSTWLNKFNTSNETASPLIPYFSALEGNNQYADVRIYQDLQWGEARSGVNFIDTFYGSEENNNPYISIVLNFSSVGFGLLGGNTTNNPAANTYQINVSTNCNAQVNFSALNPTLANGSYNIPSSNMKFNYTVNANNYPDLLAFNADRLVSVVDNDIVYPRYYLDIPANQYAGLYTGNQFITSSCS
jgi:hypothetical protein